MTRPDLDAIRARAQSVETDSSARACDALLAYDALSLLTYIKELESRVTYTVGETEWSHRIAVAEQRFVDEYDAHQETRTLLTDLYMKQLRADAAQMREYGISYDGVRKLIAECVADEMNVGKVVELLRAAAHELAKEEIAELKARITTLEGMR